MGFWAYVSRFILTNRILILLAIAAATFALLSQTENIKISNTEANMLPSDHPASITYDKFLKVFGEEGNLILIAVKDSSFFTPKKFNNWNALSQQLDSIDEVDFTFSLGDIQKLKKDVAHKRFVVEPLYDKQPETVEEVNTITKALFRDLPFFDNFIYNKETKTIQTLIYLKKDIVNTVARKDFVLKKLNPIIAQFEKDNNLTVHVSGMPYIRTMNSQSIVDEIGTFVGLAFGVTALIFFFFFRSFRATFIAMSVVAIGVVWAFGIIGAFQYELTVLTALIPPLIIVIGVPNAIFLINKYQQEIKTHGNQAKSLQRVISKIGNATLMTNITTASGFATFIFTKSQLLKEFGIIASINIMVIFVLSILLIPIIYSFMPIPKDKHLKHLEKRWIEKIILFFENIVRHHRFSVYAATLVIVIVSMIGIYMIKVSGSLIDDMPKDKTFYKDIVFFEKEFGGIMPLEIMIDTKKKKGVSSLATLKRMEKLDETIDDIPQLSKSISILNIVKYSKQAFYNGNPKYYKLPTSQEKNFILSYTRNSNTNSDLLKNFVDSTGRYARMTTFMKDVGTNKMALIEERIQERVAKVFPKEKYEVTITGKALLFLKGTKYLTKNLIVSLSLAIFLIALFMAWIFRSFRMILISIIPNMLPLLMTAGIMGYIGVPIKPSTILVFSIAFGISVDDTIHFLAKYRQELQANNWRIKKSVYRALRETGISMFYTSIVLYFGFLVFTASSFGGTIALGGLVSVTLLFAMVSNLVLLPSLLLSLDQNIANKSVLKEPSIKILEIDDEN